MPSDGAARHSPQARINSGDLMMVRYRPRRDADERRASARELIRAILDAPGILPSHRKEFVGLALWKVTMSDTFNDGLRYRSVGALEQPGAKLQHEHVYRRERMAAALIAQPDRIDELLPKAVGCLVTVEEHRRLGQVGDHVDGWERYARAGVSVIDMATGTPLDLSRPSA
jgi:hypothetical protein